MVFKQIKYGYWRKGHIPNVAYLFIFTVTLVFFAVINIKSNVTYFVPEIEEIKIADSQKGYLIKTKGCRIPDLPVTSKELEHYFEYEYSGAHCNKDIPPLVNSNLTSLFLVKESYPHYNISDEFKLKCCYKEIRRRQPKSGESDNKFEINSSCFEFDEDIKVEEEFVQVKCTYDKKNIYQDLFAFIPLKNNVFPDFNQEKLNVLMIGIDAVSRLNFHRQMPKTVNTLKNLRFNEFLGYNKIADNTYPNLIAALTGYDEEETMKTCRNSTVYYDNCTFIWKDFKINEYITSYAEDSAWMGTFNYQKYGFLEQPTDYMWSFFDYVAEKLIGNSHSMNVDQCIGARETHKVFLQYMYDFVAQMKSWKFPYFAFFWGTSLSHDFLNKPRIADTFYSNMFQNMYNKGFFENTVVVVMSDHGLRWGDFRQTYQGRIEERLPFLFVRLPNDFTNKYTVATANLKVNLRRLTSCFDLYETLYDLANPDNLDNDFIEKSARVSKSKYGFSLFHRISPSRTCEDAGIADHWCTCLDSKPLKISGEEVKHATAFAVNHMNTLLKGYAQCANLTLKTINNAQLLSHAEETLETKIKVKDYLVSFITEPGGGSFESTVRKIGSNKMEIVGTISRMNLYGTQSACITDFHLKLYCYCKTGLWS